MGKGMKRDIALEIASLTRHQFYLVPSGRKGPGRPKSTHTQRLTSAGLEQVENSMVEQEMIGIEQDPDLRCGSLRMQQQLQLKGFIINRKKVFAMMVVLGIVKQNKRKGKSTGRTFVRYRVVNPTRPLMVLEMDIKQHWIIKDRCSAYTLTVIDAFTREVLGKMTGYSMKAIRVKEFWDKIIEQHLEPAGMATSEVQIEIRCDNGPQFIAQLLRDYFKENYLNQVYTNPYTPQENGHIESFHGIMTACIGSEFFSLHELEDRLERFYFMYNNHRTHSATKGLPPVMFRRAWEHDLVITCYSEKKPIQIKLRHPLYEIPGILSQREHLAKQKTCMKKTDKKESGEISSSANNFRSPVYTSPSVASCIANKHINLIPKLATHEIVR
jgi:transposase InsO family protein